MQYEEEINEKVKTFLAYYVKFIYILIAYLISSIALFIWIVFTFELVAGA